MPRLPRALALLGLALSFAAAPALAQNLGQIEGRVTQQSNGSPVPGANVVVDGTSFGTATEPDGTFALRLPTGTYVFRVSAVGFQARTDSVTIRKNETARLDVALEETDIEMEGVEVEAEEIPQDAGVYTLDPRTAEEIPSPLNDGLRAIKVLPGVTSNNETSYQYSVRGGGYNENLYYIDGFEVYTPFRTKQGEQEGLGIVNLDMTDRLTLYAGGFPARYGGKLSSALDVAYARPGGDGDNTVAGGAYASTLDAGGHLKLGLLGGRLGVALAARSARPEGFFGTQELKGEYDPEFADVQSTVTYRIAEGHEIQGLGLLLDHRFRLVPTTRRTFFGTFQDLRSVSFGFDGLEEDGYTLGFGGVRVLNTITNALRVEHDVSYFDVEEFETLNIAGSVGLFRIDNPFEDPDDPTNLIQTGAASQRDTTNNNVRVSTLSGGGRYRLSAGRHAAELGWTARRFSFDDRLFEVSYLAGRAENGNPVEVPADSLSDQTSFSEEQVGVYLQDAVDVLAESGKLVVTGGVRADYFTFNDELTVSPRLSARYVWNPLTTVTAAAGVYHQAPTYRELRGEPIFDSTTVGSNNIIRGTLNRDIRSQRAIQFIGGVERFFPKVRFYGRAEAYYKALSNLITYDVENVRTVYSGENDADGYAFGFDLQLRGEFVPGLESWLNYGFLKTSEEFLRPTPGVSGSTPRPTDRRHNFALFVQDYVPNSTTWKAHLRALFGTGTPFTPPAPGEVVGGVQLQAPGFRNSQRFPEYRRLDLGITKEATLAQRTPSGNPVRLELTGEVLNVFDMTNTISYSYVADARGIWQRIPTRLTPRTVNVRMRLRF
ncbi:MAG: TonB-dependent receptor [Bacteroidota bacterium]